MRSKGSKPYIGLSILGAMYQEDEPPENLPLKANRAFVQESERAVENRDSSLKGLHKISCALTPNTGTIIFFFNY